MAGQDGKKRFAIGSRAAASKKNNEVKENRPGTAPATAPERTAYEAPRVESQTKASPELPPVRYFEEQTMVFNSHAKEDVVDFDDPALDFAPSVADIINEINFDSQLPEERAGSQKRAVKKGADKTFFSNFAAWFRAKTLNKVIVIASAIALVAIPILILTAPRISQQPVKPVEPDDVDIIDYDFVDEGEYAGVLLTKTKDAGDSYLDETLFIGDSNTARINLYGFLPLKNVIGIESMGIHDVLSTKCVYFEGYTNPVTIPEAVKMMQPRRIVICFGTNNLTMGTAKSFTETYKTVLDEIHEAYPYSDIIIAAIPPIGRFLSGTALKQTTIDEYNLALIELAKSEGYTFLNISEALKDSSGYIKDNYIIEDGIHISKAGFQVLGKYFRTHSHIVKDTRPMPLDSIPARRPAPVIKKESEVDTALVVEKAMALFIADGFKAATSDIDLNKGVQAMFSVPYEETADEETVASNLVQSVKAQTGLTSGYISISVKDNESSETSMFTVRIVPDPEKCVHQYGELTPDASTFFSCVGGIQTKTCSVCGHKEEITVEPTTGHHVPDTGWTITKEATCTEAGTREGICSICNQKVREEIPALGHSFGEWKPVSRQEPTATADGFENQERTCSVCKKVEEQKVVLLATGETGGGEGQENTGGGEGAGGEQTENAAGTQESGGGEATGG